MQVPSAAKVMAKSLLPENCQSFIRGCRYRGYSSHVNYLLRLNRFRKQFLKANAAAPESVIVLPGNCAIQIPRDPDVRDAFEHFGWRTPDGVDEFTGFMEVSSDRKTFWDVGALFGIFSLAFSLRSAERRALAFEPNPVSRAKLDECIRLNPATNIAVYDFPLGLPGQMVEFERGFHYTAVAGLAVRPDEVDIASKETMSVDGLIERGFAQPDLIKIDVEGHEFEVLRGAEKLLVSSKPALALELHPDLLARKNSSALAIAEYLEQAGYVLLDTKLKRVKKSFFDRRDNFRMLAT